ncbi:MAG: molybdenum cofactor biosynthesis protein MoaE [Ruminococcaceae bacterium]|nr:molybdenum cofactor biosynthesis protein MoaE [Oscillospiraceae bacterium]
MSQTKRPSADEWLREAKADAAASDCGMFLLHNGVVRRSAKAKARGMDASAADVTGMYFSYDAEKTAAAIRRAEAMEGIRFVRVWLNEGELQVGDDIMYVLVGGDIRPRVIDCLQALVGEIKNECVTETEKH